MAMPMEKTWVWVILGKAMFDPCSPSLFLHLTSPYALRDSPMTQVCSVHSPGHGR